MLNEEGLCPQFVTKIEQCEMKLFLKCILQWLRGIDYQDPSVRVSYLLLPSFGLYSLSDGCSLSSCHMRWVLISHEACSSHNSFMYSRGKRHVKHKDDNHT